MNVSRVALLFAFLWLAASAPALAETGCEPTSRLVWLLSSDGHLWTLHPESLAVSDKGQPRCRVSAGSRPTSLAVEHQGALWLAFSGGELARVHPSSLECQVSHAQVSGIHSLAVRPVLEGGDLVAVVDSNDRRVLARLEPATGVLSGEVPLEGDGPVAFAANGQQWRLSTGVVPELWRMSIDGRVHRRVALSSLRGHSGANALVVVGDTPWILLERPLVDASSAIWKVDPVTHAVDALVSDSGHRFIAAGSIPSCVVPLDGTCQSASRIVSPADGDVLFGWKPFDVVIDGDATHVRVDAPGHSSLVEVQTLKDKRVARVSIPSADRNAPLRLVPIDSHGRDCGERVNVVRAKLALDARVTVPERLVSGASWPIEATLTPAGVDTVSRAFLDSSRLSARGVVQSQRVVLERGEDGVWRGLAEGLKPGAHELVVRWEAVGLAVETVAHVRAQDPAALVVPARVDLGRVTAGTRWQDTCVSVSMSTTGLEGESVRVSATVPDGCLGVPVTSLNGVPLPLSDGVHLDARPTMSIPVCLESVACSGVETREIELQFSSDRLPNAARASVSWAVVGAPEWTCQQTRWLGVGASFLFGLMFLGFLVPRRFERTDSVRVASQREALDGADRVSLRSLKGGRRGWYRDARFGLDASGRAVRRNDPAAVYIESGRGEIRLVSGDAPLRRFNPKTHRLEPIADTVVEPGVVYEANGVWFTFE